MFDRCCPCPDRRFFPARSVSSIAGYNGCPAAGRVATRRDLVAGDDQGCCRDDTLDRLIDLCAGLRAVVLPSLGSHAARDHAGVAVGGDVTFGIDEEAERFLVAHMRERLPGWAFYSEDGGLQGADNPEVILVVDPIDGTRPAAAGFEMACVSVAAVPRRGQHDGGVVVAAAVQEIVEGDLFVAEGRRFQHATQRGWRALQHSDGQSRYREPVLDPGFRGRPAVVLAGVLAELIDTSSVGGSVFDIGSATYSVTRILTGQLDAYVDIGPAIIAAHPQLEAEFRRVGRGHVLCNSPYDLAAVHLLCRESCLVPIGDADGALLEGRPVLGSDASYQMACIAAGNDELQRRLIEVVQRGMQLAKSRMPRCTTSISLRWSSSLPAAMQAIW